MLSRRIIDGALTGRSEGAVPSRHRHRADRARRRRASAGVAWPLAATGLLALLGARALQQAARPGEGRLAGAGFLLTATRDAAVAPLLSPEGLGAQHVAVYAALTRLFDRTDSLVGAGRELVLVLTVLSGLLLWRIVRRLGVSAPGAALAVLLAGMPLLAPSIALLDVPAQLAVPWLLLAARLTASGRPSPVVLVIAVLAAAMAVLLAPDVAVLLLAGAIAALAVGLPRLTPTARAAGAGLCVAVTVGVVLLLPRWDPQPVGPGTGMLLAVVAAFTIVGGLAAWTLPHFRVPALALIGTTLTVLLPSGRISALTVCLPLAAVLAAALGGTLVAPIPERRGIALRRAAALALVATLVVAVVALVRTPQAATGGRAQSTALLGWAESSLPRGARLVADRPLRAELLHAGGDPDVLAPPGTARADDPGAPLLRIVRNSPPDGARVVARFDGTSAAGPIFVIDLAPVAPTAEELARRRAFAEALLANPTTTTGGRAGEVLRSGELDARLLSVLAALGAQFGVGIRDLPPSPGEPDDGAPPRRALVDRIGGEPVASGTPAAERLLAWVEAQLPPFAPDAVSSTDEGVLIDFRYVSNPDALVSRTTR